jgi:voltage-gated potassium channel Kch
MALLATLIGLALILVTLGDIFNVLFHPLGSGRISRRLVKVVWSMFCSLGRRRHSILELAGPIALISVIGLWLILLLFGWALIYLPHLPQEFQISPSLDTSSSAAIFIAALYFSMTTITTLGYGDITPTTEWLRVITPLEAIFGFALLTASLSWVISIYQVLRRRRSLALEIALLREERDATGVTITRMEPLAAQQLIGSLASQLNTVWNDMLQFPITYYFTSSDAQAELSAVMLYLISLVEEGTSEDCSAEVQLSASLLQGKLHEFARLLRRDFLDVLPSASDKEILEAYALDHLHQRTIKRQ